MVLLNAHIIRKRAKRHILILAKKNRALYTIFLLIIEKDRKFEGSSSNLIKVVNVSVGDVSSIGF